MRTLFAILMLAVAANPVLAQGGEKAAIVDVIQTQLDAFRAGDRITAYNQAAPVIQRKFRDPQTFHRMVESGYGALIAPNLVEFRDLTVEGGRTVQEVLVVDSQGQSWMALYSMQQQPDGSWRVAGVRLVKLPGAST